MDRFHRLEDYILFLFLHLASVDGSLHPNERETILEKMNELFPENSQVEEKLNTLDAEYRKLGPATVEELLTESWPTFSPMAQELKNKIYVDLFDIINSDARVNEEETRVLKIFKPWLTS